MIAVDIEGSGLNYEKNSILSIGAVDIENPSRQFYDECRMWDGAEASEEALEICGFNREQINDPAKKTEDEIVRAFYAWTTETHNRILAGQNVSFDRDFLKAAAHRAKLDWDIAHRTIDTHTLAYMHMVKRDLPIPLENNRSALNLDAILNYCGVPDEPQPHNALTGAMSHAEVISRLLFDKKLLPEFEQFDIPWQ